MWKDCLLPGTVHLPNGEVRFDDTDIRNAVEQCNAKLAAGWRIPLCWEHDDEQLPVKLSMADRLANLAKNTIGDVRAFREHEGRVQFLPDVYDANDLPRLNNVKFVSPQVRRNWKDSDGHVWPGLTIQHVAATPIPKQKMQDAFQLSDGSESPLRIAEEEIIRLSEGSAVKNPEFEAFIESLKKNPKNAKLVKRLAKINLSDGEEEGDKPEEGDGAGDIKALIDALNECGITIPEEVTDIKGLIIAVKAAHGKGSEDEDDDADLNDDANASQEVQSPTPMALSFASAKTPQEKKAFARADSMNREDIRRRINRLVKAGAITPKMATPALADAERINLSYTEDGELRDNKLTLKLAAWEELPKAGAWSKRGKRTNLSNAEEVESPIPADRSPDESREAAEKRQDEFDKMVSRKS